ncbi:MAG: (d)CMP kinase [Alphaproteobacteria bacterium]|nr:(d)CMP kinase [Alphaproteobacteria bacterium]
MIITIDGPAAAGKGTLAGALAEKYKLAYFDTGMVYRAVGLQMVLSGADLQDQTKATEFAKKLTFPEMMKLSAHKDFRSDIGGQAASIVSAIPDVRSALLTMQQNFALNPVFADGTKANGAVYDGRDTGTVVCPDADLKIFITASSEVRAKRRFDEFSAKGINTTYEKVLSDMKERDERDSKRSAAPLKPADDAVIIDTSSLGIKEVLAKVCSLIDALK